MTLFFTVLGASVFGSMHCAGMCGPLVLLYSSGKGGNSRNHGLYHGGRLVTYATLGALAGAFGGLVDFAGALLGIAELAAIIAAAAIALWGIAKLIELRGGESRKGYVEERLSRLSLAVSKRALRLPAGIRALGLGLASALLPCGWLYAFVTVAAGTGHWSLGALAMTGFWIGTVPALLAVAIGAKSFLSPLRAKLPLIGALSLVIVGLATVGLRASRIESMVSWTAATAEIDAATVAGSNPAPPSEAACH